MAMDRTIFSVAMAGLVMGALPLAPVWLRAAAEAQVQTDPQSEQAVIAAVRAAIARDYVVPEKRAPLDAILAKGLASGRYHGVDPQELAQRVTQDLFAVAHDKHLNLSFNPQMAAHLPDPHAADAADDENSPFFLDQARRANHGISDLKLLEGNVRMMTYDGFIWTRESAAAMDQAMAFLRGGDAVIIDLRGNGGGDGTAVRHLASYFVPKGTLLITNYFRSDPADPSISEEVPGGRIAAPVYVLTSGRTASAAEEFASHVSRLGFGTLVGETTAGAGYHNDLEPMPGGFVLSLSIGRALLPDGSNWEGKGVAPKVATDRDAALDTAEQLALAGLAAKAPAGPDRTFLEWSAALHGARVNPVTPRLPLQAYTGRYGTRTIALENGHLTYQPDGLPKSPMVAVGANVFALELFPRNRLRFAETGDAVTGFTAERADGSHVEVTR
jgi:hypothetical protein